MTPTPPPPTPAVRSRLSGVVRFVFAHQFQTAVMLVTGLVATPFLLAWLGQERFGLVRVLDAWAAFLGIALWCVGVALGAGLVSRLAAGDWPGVSRLVSASAIAAFGAAVVVVAGGAAVLVWLPDLNPAGEILRGEWKTAFLITLAGVLLGPLAVARTLFEADQRGYRVSLVLTGSGLLTTGLALTAASLGWGLPGQALATLTGGAASAVALAVWAFRTYPQARPVRPPRAEVWWVVGEVARLLVAGVGGTLATRAEVLAVNHEGGADTVTRYVLTQRLFGMWQGQLVAIGTALWAPLSDLFSRGERDAFRRRLRTALSAVVGLGFAGAVAFVGYTHHFLRLWGVGEEQYVGPVAVCLFGLLIPLAAVYSVQGWVITGTGLFRRWMFLGIVYAVAAGCGCFGLGAVWGLDGVAAGVVVGQCAVIGACAWVMARDLGVSASVPFWPLARGLALAAPVGALSLWAGQSHVPYGWLGLLAEMGGWFGLFLALWYATGGSDARAEWKQLLRRLLRR